MFNHAAKAFFVTGCCSGCGFLATLMVQNALPRREKAGRYVLLLTVIQVLALLIPLGHEKLFRRYFANYDIADHAWRAHLKGVLFRGLPLLVLTLAACAWFYRMNAFEIAFTALAVTASASCLLLGAVLQVRERFARAALAVGGQRIVFVLSVAVALFLIGRGRSDAFRLVACQAALPAGFALLLVLSIVWTRRLAAEGVRPIPGEHRKESRFFLATTVSLLVYGFTDRLLVPALLGEAELARYFAVVNPFLVFDMAAMALGGVLVVRAARTEVAAATYAWRLAAVAAGGYALCLLVCEPLVHFLYQGRYDDAAYLIPLVGLTKSLNLVLVVPTSLLGGRLGRKALGFFARTNLLLTPVNVAMVAWLIAYPGHHRRGAGHAGDHGPVAGRGLLRVVRLLRDPCRHGRGGAAPERPKPMIVYLTMDGLHSTPYMSQVLGAAAPLREAGADLRLVTWTRRTPERAALCDEREAETRARLGDAAVFLDRGPNLSALTRRRLAADLSKLLDRWGLTPRDRVVLHAPLALDGAHRPRGPAPPPRGAGHHGFPRRHDRRGRDGPRPALLAFQTRRPLLDRGLPPGRTDLRPRIGPSTLREPGLPGPHHGPVRHGSRAGHLGALLRGS